VSLKVLPPRVRAHLYLFWVGMALSAAGIVGFFVSFWQVGSPKAAALDVHTDVPVFAYASIFAWGIGLAIMWYSRRKVDAAVAAKLKETREAAYVDLGEQNDATAAPEGREAYGEEP
jgi:hypothetical protein